MFRLVVLRSGCWSKFPDQTSDYGGPGVFKLEAKLGKKAIGTSRRNDFKGCPLYAINYSTDGRNNDNADPVSLTKIIFDRITGFSGLTGNVSEAAGHYVA